MESLEFESDRHWTVTKMPDTETVRLREEGTGFVYEVPASRVRKARTNMLYSEVSDGLHPKWCRCGKECYSKLSAETVRNRRYELLRLPSEANAAEHIAGCLRRSAYGYVVGGQTVCATVYRKVWAVGEKKLKLAMRMAKKSGPIVFTRNKRPGGNLAVKTRHSYAFWDQFFDKYCQRPTETLRLFPVNKSMRLLYEQHFLPWWAGQNQPEAEKPGISTFKAVRWTSDFKDVTRRAKHHHCRCATCHSLSSRLLRLTEVPEDLRGWQRDWRLHNESVCKWRTLEGTLKAQAQDPNSDLILLEYDDTQAMGVPRLQHRPIKNLTKTRFNVVPWFCKNHSTGVGDYVYMSKNRYEKGANRLITMLHASLRRVKADYTHPHYQRRQLVIIADNASDNKNNELLGY